MNNQVSTKDPLLSSPIAEAHLLLSMQGLILPQMSVGISLSSSHPHGNVSGHRKQKNKAADLLELSARVLCPLPEGHRLRCVGSPTPTS